VKCRPICDGMYGGAMSDLVNLSVNARVVPSVMGRTAE